MTRWKTGLVMAAGLCTAAVAWGYGPPDMAVPPAALRGAVLWTDGKTPVVRLRVRVWDADRERCIYRTRTDENGVFTIPELGEGNRYVTVGPVKIDLTVFRERAGALVQQHGIVVILPKLFAFPTDFSPAGGAAVSAAAVSALPNVTRPTRETKYMSP